MAKQPDIRFFSTFWKDLLASESGAAMLEYAFLVFLIGVVLIAVLEAIGISFVEILDIINDAFDGAEASRGA